MTLLGKLNRLVPDSRLKAAAKRWFMQRFRYRFTGRPRSYRLLDGIELSFYPLVFADHSIGNFELIGYEKYYQLKPGDVVIDGGGFQGVYALFAAKKVGPSGRVLVFEPDSVMAGLIERNLKLNRIDNVQIIRKGLWSREAVLGFDHRGNASNLDFEGTRDREGLTRVEVTSLDCEIDRLGLERVDFVKMNIEGAEIEAVEGCRGAMARFPLHFSIVCDHFRDGELTAERVRDALDRGGYEAVIDYPEHLSVYAWRRSERAGIPE